MGFAQQYYVTADQLDQVGEDSRAQVLLRAVLLDEDQIAAYGDLLQPIPDDGLTNCTQDTYAEDWHRLPCRGRGKLYRHPHRLYRRDGLRHRPAGVFQCALRRRLYRRHHGESGQNRKGR